MPGKKRLAAVIGAFSYSGSYIARALMEEDWDVVTLTRRPDRPHPLQGKIPATDLDFSKLEKISDNLRGVDTLVNTYWVRFNHPGSTFGEAIANTSTLLKAAKKAGVRRFVHLSVSNPDINSKLPYYRGKAEVETIIKDSGLSYLILQPTLIFGKEELLVNNIAWLLRHLPLFIIPGKGDYRLQPIHVEDLANVAANGASSDNNQVIPAAGPDILSFTDLIHFLSKAMGSRTRILYAHPQIALGMAKVLSVALRDVLLTNDELSGLMEERLYVGDEVVGTTGFREWALENVELLGRQYTNELHRHHSIS